MWQCSGKNKQCHRSCDGFVYLHKDHVQSELCQQCYDALTPDEKGLYEKGTDFDEWILFTFPRLGEEGGKISSSDLVTVFYKNNIAGIIVEMADVNGDGLLDMAEVKKLLAKAFKAPDE